MKFRGEGQVGWSFRNGSVESFSHYHHNRHPHSTPRHLQLTANSSPSHSCEFPLSGSFLERQPDLPLTVRPLALQIMSDPIPEVLSDPIPESKVSPLFNQEPSADTITFRSSDNVLFHIEKLHAMSGSSVWRDMIEVGQGGSTAHAQLRSPSSLLEEDIVAVTESATTLSFLLECVAPLPLPRAAPFSQEEVFDVVRAARKYDIPRALSVAEDQLHRCLDGRPIQVYALACEVGLEDEVKDLFLNSEQMKTTASLRNRELDEKHMMGLSGVDLCRVQAVLADHQDFEYKMLKNSIHARYS